MAAPLPQPTPAREGRSSREIDAFCVQFAPRAPGHPAVRDLQKLLAHVPQEGHEARLEWVERWVDWLRDPLPALGLEEPAEAETPAVVTRLALLVRVLETRASAREAVAALVREVVAGTSGLKLFAQVGLPAGQGFLSEVTDRLSRRLLPSPPEDSQLSELLLRLFPAPGDAAWLEALPPPLLARLSSLVGSGARPPAREPRAVVHTDLVDALSLLAVQTASLGLTEDVRDRCPEVSFRSSPFLKLRRICEGVQAREAAPETLRELGEVVEECRQVVTIVSSHLEQYGVSVDLVYRLERLRRNLERMEAIARVLDAAPGEARWREGLALMTDLLRRAHEDRSVWAVVASNARLLARKVIERAGHTGEHYITSTRAEYHHMVHAAAGGGLLTAFTALLKLYAGSAGLPPFFLLLALAGNYMASFLLMQALAM